jgi:hypothetical protein
MNTSLQSLTLEDIKKHAARLRATLLSEDIYISHSKSLELIAIQYGYKNWNILHATVGNQPPVAPVYIGQQLCGEYLGQTFSGEVLGITMLSNYRYRLTLDFDEPVDVVAFDSFSNFRKRVSCTIDASGTTQEKTSNGKPQLKLFL